MSVNVNVGVGQCERNKARHKGSVRVSICSEFRIREYVLRVEEMRVGEG